MDLNDAARVCQDVDNGTVCNITWDLTHNRRLAVVSDWLIGKPLAILALILTAVLIRWLLHRVIDRLASRAAGGAAATAAERRAQRAKTIASLMKSVVTTVMVVIVAVMVIDELGYNVAPIIASAGIVGIALGFGAQNLVKDYLAGIFMIIEDQYGVGDAVDLGEASGTVEAVSLRVTRVRDVNGTVWYVRNGEILRVGNQSQNWARTVLDIPVAFSEDINRIRGILQDVAHGLWEDEDFNHRIIEEPEVWGVERWEPDGVVVRVTLKTAPLEQWSIAREMRERIKARFDYEGVEIPLPQRVVWQRESPTPSGEPSGE